MTRSAKSGSPGNGDRAGFDIISKNYNLHITFYILHNANCIRHTTDYIPHTT